MSLLMSRLRIPAFVHCVHRDKIWTIDLWDGPRIPQMTFKRKSMLKATLSRMHADLHAWLWFGLTVSPFVSVASKSPGETELRTVFHSYMWHTKGSVTPVMDLLNQHFYLWVSSLGLRRQLVQRLTFEELVKTQPKMDILRFKGFDRCPGLVMQQRFASFAR